jgi:hypothetical protein
LIAAAEDEYSKTSVKSQSTRSLVGGSGRKTVKMEGAATANGSDWTIGGALQANIAGDLVIYGSSVSAQGDIALNAQSVNVINAVGSRYDQTTKTKSRYAIRKSITTSSKAAADIETAANKGSSVVSNGSLLLTTSLGGINILGSDLSAQNAIVLDSARDVSGYMSDSQRIKNSLFTDWSFSKTTTDIEKEMGRTAVASNLDARDIRIYSAGDLLVKGSNINADTGEIAVLGAIDVTAAQNVHFRSAEHHVSKVGLDTVILATSSGAAGGFIGRGPGGALSEAWQGFSDSTGFGGALLLGESLQNGGYREYRGSISTTASVTATQSEIALGSASTIIAKNNINLEAAKIETGTIGAGYQKQADGSLAKVNGEASLNITDFDETTTTQSGSYREGFNKGVMMVYQMGKAAAVSKAGDAIKDGIKNNAAALEQLDFLGDIIGKEIPSWLLFGNEKTYAGQFIGEQIIGGVIGKFDPSLIDKPDITDPSIFNLKDPVIQTNNSVGAAFTGSVNVLD